MQEGKSQTYLELNYEAMIIEKHLTSDHIFSKMFQIQRRTD